MRLLSRNSRDSRDGIRNPDGRSTRGVVGRVCTTETPTSPPARPTLPLASLHRVPGERGAAAEVAARAPADDPREITRREPVRGPDHAHVLPREGLSPPHVVDHEDRA